ncbi:MAG TPA: TRAP transporter TatT component family protein, partial [Anaeromyxobacteraceae bacterium]
AEVPLSRAEALRAMADPAAAEAAWLASMRAAERALRRLAPGFAAAVDRGDPVARAAGEVGRDGAEALYLWGQGAAGLARQRGFGALLAAGPSVAAALSRAAELDERVDRGGPRRALGSWLAALPSAAGGGAGRARREFARARALAPEDLLCRVREAESLAVLLQDPALFDRLLAEVLAFDLRRAPEAAAENALAQRQARELLARRDRLF